MISLRLSLSERFLVVGIDCGDASTCKLQTHGGTLEMERPSRRRRSCRRRPRVFKEKAGGLLQTQQRLDSEKSIGFILWENTSSPFIKMAARLRMADSHTGNHLEDDFTPLETFRGSDGDRRDMVVMVMMPRPSTGPSTGPLTGLSTGPLTGPSTRPSTGSSRIRPGVFEEKARGLRGEGPGSSRRRPGVFSELNRGRKRRLHPLGEYIITLCTSGNLRTRVMVTLISEAGGHTPKGVGLCVADSHTGNHRDDDFTPSKTFEGFPSAFGMWISKAMLCDRVEETMKCLSKEVASCRNRGGWLLRRPPQMLHAVVKAAIEVAGCYEGCHTGCWLLRRLPHRLQAIAKAATLLKRLHCS
uniref:Uncharacterized protein n=1 Tax=Tanacetum cinerariifolium TaxID=118510 RepID=A0A6L2J1M9_TANCI|nr:hypothetical protein [Tanacetum cinerariifolium]